MKMLLGKHRGKDVSEIPYGDLMWYADEFPDTLTGKMCRKELDKRNGKEDSDGSLRKTDSDILRRPETKDAF